MKVFPKLQRLKNIQCQRWKSERCLYLAYMASGNKNPYIIMHFLSKEDVANRRQLFSRLVCEIYDGDPPISSKNILMIVTL